MVQYVLKRVSIAGKIAFEPPADSGASENIKRELRKCRDKHNDYVLVTMQPPKRPRTTGKDSQNHHLNGHILQICGETSNDYDTVKYCVKMIAVEQMGYPNSTGVKKMPVMIKIKKANIVIATKETTGSALAQELDGVKIQRTYENYELFMSNPAAVKVGDRVRIPAFRVPPAEVEGENKMSFEEIKVNEYATVYDRDENFIHLVFDRALFRSAVDNNNTKLWCDTQLAQYLRGTFLAALARKTKATDCGLLRKEDLWGDDAKPFFKHGRNRICFDNDEDVSVCYWLETPVNASAASFCCASGHGNSTYFYASFAAACVRPRFTILI